MHVKDVSFSNPRENILCDELFLSLAEKNNAGAILRFWESAQYFVVLGRISKEDEDVNWKNVLADKIPVLRRASGGGTVVQGKGCLNYALILPKSLDPDLNDIKKSYRWVSDRIVKALQTVGIEACFKPISDIALVHGEKKISGNAQKRGKNFILHHGTILYGFDLGKIEKYLHIPKDKPEYRMDRPHLGFVANIERDQKAIKEAICSVFSVTSVSSALSKEEKRALDDLLREKDIQVAEPLSEKR